MTLSLRRFRGSSPSPSHLNHRGVGLLALLALLLPLPACSGSSAQEDAIVQVAIDDRDEPVEISGDDLEGRPLDVADFRGKPVVIVVWGAWCDPCNAEAADVASVATTLGSRAQFVGIDVRDNSVDYALAFQRTYDLPYASIYSPDSAALLGFPGPLSPQSVPAFAVLDPEGRVAASIVGELPSKLTLEQLVEDVEQESGGTTDG